ncbi:MAG: hypothetical protein KBD78_03690 [Oligoflexales bacterium]|nr:hypothetical protein [Oligoflexales bacterium]
MRINLALLGLVLFSITTTARARFHPNKVESLTLEEKLGTEYYNDVYSYEWPDSWQIKWSEYNTLSSLGLFENTTKLRAAYLSSVGSLNANVFLHQEKLLLQSAPNSSFSLQLSRQRYSDLLIDEVEHELHLVFRPDLFGSYFKLMFEPMGAKKWIDIGFALGFLNRGHGFFELFYYSVDHYYNTKEEAGQGRYGKKPWYSGLKTAWNLSPHIKFTLNYAYSSPVSWTQPQFSRKTEYHDKDLEMQIDYHDEHYGRLSVFHQSHSSLHAIENQLTTAENTIGFINSGQDKKFIGSGIAWIYGLNADTELDIKFRHIERNVQRELLISDNFLQDAVVSFEPKPLSLSHQEQIISTTATQESFGVNNNLIYGFVVSNVALNKNIAATSQENQERQEVKFRFNFEHVVGESGSIIFGSNWDLDKLVDQFPYSKKRFEAWDGGSIAVSLWM